jgi:hypothetical protein
MCNIPIYFSNIHTKHLQYTSETSETFEIYACNMRSISLLLGRIKTRHRVEFTGVELAYGADHTALVEKAAAGPMEKAAAGLHIVWVERELCAG